MSKLKNIWIVVWLLAVACFINSCDKGTGLRSEKKLKKQIQGNWDLISFREKDLPETWKFENGVVFRSETDSTGTYLLDRGIYLLNGRFWGADYITISEFQRTGDKLNAKWNLIQLDDDFLIISSVGDKGTGLLTLEFVKKK